MAAIQQDITIEQGATETLVFTVQVPSNPYQPISSANPTIPANLGGSGIHLEARKSYDDAVKQLNLSTTTGEIVLTNATGGVFTVTILPSVTKAINFQGESIDLVYDIEITDQVGTVTRCFEGTLTVSREVTR